MEEEREAKARVKKEATIRARHDDLQAGELKTLVAHERTCPGCGGVINTCSGMGIEQSDSDAWKMLCKNCGAEIPQES